MFGYGILELLEGSLLGGFGRRGICEGEDVLGVGKIRVFGVLRVRTHDGGCIGRQTCRQTSMTVRQVFPDWSNTKI